MDIYSLKKEQKIYIIIDICIVIIAILLFFAFTSTEQEEELHLQIISTEYSEPTISTINKVTYYKPAQFKITFKDNMTDSYYSTDNKDVYEYLETQNNFIYNVKICIDAYFKWVKICIYAYFGGFFYECYRFKT